jgi:transposase
MELQEAQKIYQHLLGTTHQSLVKSMIKSAIKKIQSKNSGGRELDVYIFFLPRYSHELNLIEIMWSLIKYQTRRR